MRFAQNFAVPLLLFRSIARLDLSAAYDAGLMISFYTGAFAGFGLCFARRALAVPPAPCTDAVAIGFAGLFSNSLLLGPADHRARLRGRGADRELCDHLDPCADALRLRHRADGMGAHARAGAVGARGWRGRSLRAILTQPLVIGILGGVLR